MPIHMEAIQGLATSCSAAPPMAHGPELDRMRTNTSAAGPWPTRLGGRPAVTPSRAVVELIFFAVGVISLIQHPIYTRLLALRPVSQIRRSIQEMLQEIPI